MKLVRWVLSMIYSHVVTVVPETGEKQFTLYRLIKSDPLTSLKKDFFQTHYFVLPLSQRSMGLTARFYGLCLTGI